MLLVELSVARDENETPLPVPPNSSKLVYSVPPTLTVCPASNADFLASDRPTLL